MLEKLLCVSLSRPFSFSLPLSLSFSFSFILSHHFPSLLLTFLSLSFSISATHNLFFFFSMYTVYTIWLSPSLCHSQFVSPSLSLSLSLTISRSLLTSHQTFNISLAPSTNFSLSLLLTTPYFFPLINADFSGLQNCLDYFIPITVCSTFVRVRSVATPPVKLVTVFWSPSI